ncbi:gp080 [Erwinia phage vB_EamP-S6]|uniref:Gp080 n=1 Tax=Erwinia phage vB_EamP-S6 TaxID=1051675 RepID=G0YQH2_9CAUD|nr:gp080 [Erwinia phage vB_EamP-S6]AEJ81599.1 gp080 [Erwinia phage vB_EamP-S6]
MAALTWRNVDAPDLSGAIRTLSDSNASLQNAFSGAGLALRDWGRGVRDSNTGNIELALSKFGTNTDLQTAIQQGLLDPDALRQNYGNFDASAIARYQNDLATSLQGREVAQQGIDKTNNLNQFGGQIGAIQMAARNGDPTAQAQWDALVKGGLRGDVAADYGQQIAGNLGAAGQDAETRRAHRADESNAAANTAISRGNLSLRQQEFDAGAKQRLLQGIQTDNALNNQQAQLDGTSALRNLGDKPMSQFKQDEVLRLQKEGKSNDYISNYVGGLDKAFNISTSGSPNAPVADATLAAADPIVKGNVSAANESINANYESKDTDYRTWRDSRQQEFTDINKATDAILQAVPDTDRSTVRDYLNQGVSQQRPLGLLVAAAKNNTESTKWGAATGWLPGVSDNSSKFDVNAALKQAGRIQDTNATNRLTALDTQRAADEQRMTAATNAVTSASALFKEMSTRFGANSAQAQAAYKNVNDAIAAQSNLRQGFSQSAQATLQGGNPTDEDLQRAAIYAAQLKRAGITQVGR